MSAKLDLTREGRYGLQQNIGGHWQSCTINGGYDDLRGLKNHCAKFEDLRIVDRDNGYQPMQ